jgi:endonuclease G
MRKSDLKDKAAVEAAVRQVAGEYLKDPNINSVGIGYKTEKGKPTSTLALQFTVGTKFEPQALQAIATQPIPETVEANGITFETDVVERDFTSHPVAVATRAKDRRKRRLDPIVPGVSVANAREQIAGTLGCLVKDSASGELRMLSNWHVLDGNGGEIGDAIVQPGPFDDNTTDGNACGALTRSFLGLAGDCAIATVSGRVAKPEILGLDVAVRRIGDPELGDRVVKSGRTTALTYGLVTRVHTITKINYGATGEEQIGGFEIGPDDKHPADNGEISMNGDSGSAWMAVAAGGGAEDMMLGLHFAGETVEPAEYALACYASSVFTKLEISPLKEGAADRAVVALEASTAGYDPGFLAGQHVGTPAARPAIEKDIALTKAGDDVRDYTHFSLAMSKSRRFCRWVAWNIDGSSIRKLPRRGFVLDKAYDAKYQVGAELYSKPKNDLDQGHIARRADLVWGTEDEARQANTDSFYYTNITPQLDTFNQSSRHGLWGELENAIFDDVDVENLRLSVFGGPIFKDNDFPYRKVLVPRSFWKVIAYVEGGQLKAKAYVLTQDNLEAKLEALGLEPFELFQVSLAELTKMTGLKLADLAQADTMAAAPQALGVPEVRRIRARSEIVAG